MFRYITTLSVLLAHGLALADPHVTAVAQLAPRAADPSLVGYISQSGGFDNGRTCDFPQTVSTSGSFFQCCSASGPCNFYTACSSNTLLGASTAVPCDFDATLTCNTAVVVPTVGAANGAQYLACWQKTLGSSPFTFVQDIGSASVVAPTTTGSTSASSSSSGSSSGRTSQASTSSSRTSSSSGGTTSASTTSNAAVQGSADLSGGVLGFLAMLAQMLL